jgi:serine/threonine-protein kinase HipA
MSVNGKQDGFTFEDLKTVADRMGIKHGKKSSKKWSIRFLHGNSFAQEAGVTANQVKEIKSNLLLLRP